MEMYSNVSGRGYVLVVHGGLRKCRLCRSCMFFVPGYALMVVEAMKVAFFRNFLSLYWSLRTLFTFNFFSKSKDDEE